MSTFELDGVVAWPTELATRWRELGYWRGETHWSFLADRARAHPDRAALVDGDASSTRLTYAGLAARAERIAAGFAGRGVRRGDRVVVQLPNRSDFVAVIFGLFRLGALPVFALPAHRSAEIGYFLRHTGAVGYVMPGVHAGFDYATLVAANGGDVPALAWVARPDELDGDPASLGDAGPEPDDVAFLQLSGGSTGLPKLIPRTHDEYVYSVRESAAICGLSERSVYLAVLPAAHNFTLSSPGMLGTLYAGGTVVLAPEPRPDVAFQLIERHRVTITAVVPALAQAWLTARPNSSADLSSLEVLQVGGARLAEAVAERLEDGLGCRLQQVFGMAEGLVNYTRLDDPVVVRQTTQGRPISPADELRIVDDADRPVPSGEPGHLLTRGPYTIRGYYRADAHNRTAFTTDGFYRTGDIVRLTPQGNVEVVGRAKDQINRGGEKIAAEEVEGHIAAHPDVTEVAVIGHPDEHLGERLVAYVVVVPGSPLTGIQVKQFVRSRGVAAFKVPDKVVLVGALDRTAVGKTSKRALREIPT